MGYVNLLQSSLQRRRLRRPQSPRRRRSGRLRCRRRHLKPQKLGRKKEGNISSCKNESNLWRLYHTRDGQ